MDLGLGLRRIIKQLQGKVLVDEQTVQELIRELQRVLIASDVNVRLVLALSERIKKQALEKELKGWDAKEHLIKLLHDELVTLLGGGSYSPPLKPHRILLVGLYGSGKTTTAAKLARFYKRKGLSVALVAADVTRPAAGEQLKQLAAQAEVSFFEKTGVPAADVVTSALSTCREDILIIDTAGRNALDEDLARELLSIKEVARPHETFLVVSADSGQRAGAHAEAFHKLVGLSGVIVTKMDGSGKGGGALSAVSSTHVPIAFIGTGEKLDAFEPFDSTRFVSRLLGFPDLPALIAKIKELEQQDFSPLEKEEEFTIKAFYEQLKMVKRMGGFTDLLSMVGMPDIPKEIREQGEEKLRVYEAIINSMTPAERLDPRLLRKERGRLERIARGSGRSVEEVKRMLNEFEKMEKLFRKMKGDRGMMRKMRTLMGKFS